LLVELVAGDWSMTHPIKKKKQMVGTSSPPMPLGTIV